jgi:hypothetical protein
MWLVARTRANEREVVQQALRLTQLENGLAAAAIQARRGDYEPAREAASTFYTNLRAEVDRSPSGFTGHQREMMPSPLAQRDQLITLLARRPSRRRASGGCLRVVSANDGNATPARR